MQPRFERRSGRRAMRFLEHRSFRAAYDFLLLRAASGEADPAVADWWTAFQEMSDEERLAAVGAQPGGDRGPGSKPRKRPRRRRRRPTS
jgi:poly(A) polymerase